MKAWIIRERDSEYAIPVHAETRNKAKSKARRVWPDLFAPDWIDLRVRRFPEGDDKPLNFETVQGHFYDPEAPGGELTPKTWINFCSCELCQADRYKERIRKQLEKAHPDRIDQIPDSQSEAANGG